LPPLFPPFFWLLFGAFAIFAARCLLMPFFSRPSREDRPRSLEEIGEEGEKGQSAVPGDPGVPADEESGNEE
jgi:hypothetical protein